MFVARTRELRPLHVIVQGKHMDVTPALRGYAETKIGKIARYFDQVQDAQVVLSVERRGGLGKAQVVEITVRGDGVVLRGEDASSDMYASIDLVVAKLKKQIEKYRRDRKSTRLNSSHGYISYAVFCLKKKTNH